MIAPVVMFVYNRYKNVEKSLTSLCKNYLADKTDLYIFSDGPKNNSDRENVIKVRNILNDKKIQQYFKSVTIIESDTNKGLANSIISGVDEIINKYGRVIVLEDDCISNKSFLSFMNKCLEFYENDKKIWSIGGYSSNVNIPDCYDYDVYIMGRTCSYAWATWSNRFNKVDWDVVDYNDFKYDFARRRQFNEYGMDRSRMLDEQQLGIKDSWAIRFCYSMFLNNMYTVYPVKTKIKNIGYDLGTHTSRKSFKNSDLFSVNLYEEKNSWKLSHNLRIDPTIKQSFVKKFNRSTFKLFIAYIINVILKIKRR